MTKGPSSLPSLSLGGKESKREREKRGFAQFKTNAKHWGNVCTGWLKKDKKIYLQRIPYVRETPHICTVPLTYVRLRVALVNGLFTHTYTGGESRASL